MVSDDELARQIESFEQRRGRTDLGERVDRIERQARSVHDELFHRVEATRANAATRDDLSDVVERLDAIESRLDELEADVQSAPDGDD